MSETRVPLELVNLHNDGFHLLVEVVVFGQSFHVVLDTGASKTVFDKTIIEKHMKNTELLSSELLSTGLGTSNMESHTIVLPVLKIGKFKLKNFSFMLNDISA